MSLHVSKNQEHFWKDVISHLTIAKHKKNFMCSFTCLNLLISFCRKKMSYSSCLQFKEIEGMKGSSFQGAHIILFPKNWGNPWFSYFLGCSWKFLLKTKKNEERILKQNKKPNLHIDLESKICKKLSGCFCHMFCQTTGDQTNICLNFYNIKFINNVDFL